MRVPGRSHSYEHKSCIRVNRGGCSVLNSAHPTIESPISQRREKWGTQSDFLLDGFTIVWVKADAAVLARF